MLKGNIVNSLGRKWTSRCEEDNDIDDFDHLANQRRQRDKGDNKDDENDHNNDQNYHITIINSNEMKLLTNEQKKLFLEMINTKINDENNTLSLYDIGVGCYQNRCYYIILYIPFLQKIRIKFNLSPIDFHITLGFINCDVHDVRKGFSSLIKMKSLLLWNEEVLQNIECILKAKSSPVVRDYLEYHRLADFASQQGYLFGAYYLAKYQNDNVIASDILEQAINDEKHCKRLQSLDDHEIDYGELVCKALNCHVYSPLRYDRYHRRRFYSSTTNGNKYEVTYVQMPRNFSFVTSNVAGSAIPDSKEALLKLAKIGITDVISLLEQPLDVSNKDGLPLVCHWFEVQDRTPPTISQMKEIMAICDKPDSKV